MVYTQSALWLYLYGHRIDWQIIDGKLVTRAEKVAEHAYRGKVVPSGFFGLPDAENVSAVLFSNAGTMPKFERMGVVAGFGHPGYRYTRIGLRHDPDPNAVQDVFFSVEVGPEKYEEGWADELQLFHNPQARHPLDPNVFSGITQHFFRDAGHYSLAQPGRILMSYTLVSPREQASSDEPAK